MFRVLVAEDSLTTRELLVQILDADPELEVVGEAKDGVEAVEMTKRLRPDVVTMDIRMPRMDGFEATRQIMVEAPTPIVIVSAIYEDRDVEGSMHALSAGALAVMSKPAGPGSADFEEHARRLATTVKSMAQVKVVRRWAPRTRVETSVAVERKAARPARVVAIGASTGGPAALARLLQDLPNDFGAPMLVVQHMSRGFMDGLASWLNTAGALPVKIAEQGEPLRPRTVYLAPDGGHLGINAGGASLLISQAAPVGSFRPSATFLFESVAKVFGASSLGLILTGMGHDGVEGLRAIRRAGGQIVAQDEATSVVYGMNGAAVAAGLADFTLPLDAIADRLVELVEGEKARDMSPSHLGKTQ
jgi:two-component system, chemotaxis family, protein-glutamate methylesterase/glutaminase